MSDLAEIEALFFTGLNRPVLSRALDGFTVRPGPESSDKLTPRYRAGIFPHASEHRRIAAQKSTEIRRRLHEVQADQAALRRRQEEFESHALAAPSATWADAAAKARYLILLFAETSEARYPRRQELIAKVLDDLARLSDRIERRPAQHPGQSGAVPCGPFRPHPRQRSRAFR
jgi:hypothetical protein